MAEGEEEDVSDDEQTRMRIKKKKQKHTKMLHVARPTPDRLGLGGNQPVQGKTFVSRGRSSDKIALARLGKEGRGSRPCRGSDALGRRTGIRGSANANALGSLLCSYTRGSLLAGKGGNWIEGRPTNDVKCAGDEVAD